MTTNTSLLPIGSLYQPTAVGAQVVGYFALTFSTTEYASGLPSFNVTLPSGTLTTNRQFYVAANSSAFATGWMSSLEGPSTATGNTVSFGSGGGNTTFDASDEEVFAIYSVPN